MLTSREIPRPDGGVDLLWVVSPKSRPGPAAPPEPVGPCPHRGGVLRVALCDLCGCGLGKGKPFEVLACSRFGECSLDRYRRDVRSCRVCQATGENVEA